ncbi:MAG: hypothetical protein HFG33_00240 [Bacilli bacterium]|nr:hypothetical protein [Bacilli bacterium]
MKYLELATFIPWILYYIEIMLYRINVFEKKGENKEKYFAHMNKNFFSSINMKELLLFSIFLIFMQYENTTVLEILFSTIYLYLLIDFFNTLAVNCTKIKHKMLMVESILLLAIIIGLYFVKDKLYTTYILMFIVSILSSFVVFAFGFTLKLKNLITKNKR